MGFPGSIDKQYYKLTKKNHRKDSCELLDYVKKESYLHYLCKGDSVQIMSCGFKNADSRNSITYMGNTFFIGDDVKKITKIFGSRERDVLYIKNLYEMCGFIVDVSSSGYMLSIMWDGKSDCISFYFNREKKLIAIDWGIDNDGLSVL